MSGRAGDVVSGSLEASLARAEPQGTRPLAELVARLAAEGRLRSVIRDGSPIEPAELGPIDLAGVADDSRRVVPGALFVALPGDHVDGHDFAPAAQAAGAVGAIVERPIAGLEGVQLVVERSAAALATAAAWWYRDPSHELSVVGVTGTDGKTTTSFLAAAVLEAAGIATGLVGTVETQVGPVRAATPGHVTTPGALELQRLLRAMVTAGDRAAVIETTSHGLAAERVGGIAYDAAVFTNLSHEHLEFHGSFEAYRAAKLSLFERLGTARPAKPVDRPRIGVVNADDPAAGGFVEATRSADARPVTYGTAAGADVRLTQLSETGQGLRLGVQAPGWDGEVEVPLAGRFNASNALAAIALGLGWGLDPSDVRAGLASVGRVPGRMERIDHGQPFEVVVDYAHTPASLAMVLDLLGPRAAAGGGGVIAVFGSAGERDLEKRPMMGRIAGERCRLVVVTDEDPRGEDRQAILDEIAAGAEAAGLRRGADLLVVADRSQAIREALARARPGDVVLLAGKGHESSIIGPAGPLPWDERAAAEAALGSLGYPGGD